MTTPAPAGLLMVDTDALIAASVEAAGATLVTLNRRHVPMLAQVLVPYSKS